MAVLKISDNKSLPPVIKITNGGVSTVSKTKITTKVF